jgi:hypothetical protein
MAAGEAPNFAYLAYVPQNAFGFIVWDTTNDAFKRLKSSPWGKGESPLASISDSLTPEVQEIVEIVKQAGVDPFAPDSIEKSAKQGALYVAQAPEGSSVPLVGAVAFEADTSVDMAKLGEALKKGIEQQMGSVTPETYGTGTGFSFDLTKSGEAAARGYAGWAGQQMALATEKARVDDFLSGKKVGLPQIVTSEQYPKSTKGFMPADQRVVEGYFDLDKLRQAAKAGLGDNVGFAGKMDEVPLNALVFASGMSDTPRGDVRVAYNPSFPEISKVKSIVKGSNSAALLKALPDNLAFYFSLDGQTLKGVKDQAVATGGVPQSAGAQLAIIDKIKRFGFGARVAPLGQSMLPLPEMSLLIETADAGSAKGQLKVLLTMAAQQAMGGQQWMTKQISGIDVDYVGNPMMSIFLANSDDMVIITSAESMMQAALAGATGSASSFADKTTAQVAELLAKRETVGNLYMNFDQIGTFIETMGSTLSMFAGQNPEIQKLLEPKEIARIKKLGVLTGGIAPEENGVFATMFYQHAPKQMAKLSN